VIPRNVKLSEAPSHGKPVILYDINSSGATAYMEAARILIRRHSPAPSKTTGTDKAPRHKPSEATNQADHT
jgi:chromosome partitioning protein